MTWWKNLFIAAFLIIQVTLPLRGYLYDRFETRGNFSWNMYSSTYKCSSLYRLDTPEGEILWPRYQDYFNLQILFTRVFHADYLPEFHRWLCDHFRSQGQLGSLRGYATCFLNNGPPVELVDRTVDICTASNFGVGIRPEVLKR